MIRGAEFDRMVRILGLLIDDGIDSAHASAFRTRRSFINEYRQKGLIERDPAGDDMWRITDAGRAYYVEMTKPKPEPPEKVFGLTDFNRGDHRLYPISDPTELIATANSYGARRDRDFHIAAEPGGYRLTRTR